MLNYQKLNQSISFKSLIKSAYRGEFKVMGRIPLSIEVLIRPAVFLTCNFEIRFLRCELTVSGVIKSFEAISFVVCSYAIKFKTSSSLSVGLDFLMIISNSRVIP